MKFSSKGTRPKSKITLKWRKVGDTKLGHVDFKDFKRRMYGHDVYLPTTIAQRMMRNRIVQEIGFPLAVECSELIVECAIHYNARKRQIIAPDGRVLVYLEELSIQEEFKIPNYHTTTFKTKEETTRLYEEQLEPCGTIINKLWLDKLMPTYKKMLKKILHTYFKEDYGDIILLLNRVMDNPRGVTIETWMYYFIDEITIGVKMFNWARIISNTIDEQLRNLERTKSFYMTSYIIYLLYRNYRYM